MSSKKGGFTEAELIAASWRKELKKQEDSKNNINNHNNDTNKKKEYDIRDKDNNSNKNDYVIRDRDNSYNNKNECIKRDKDDRYNRLRSSSNDRDSRRGRRSRSPNHRNYSKYPTNSKSYSNKVEVDEFGRDIIPGMIRKRYNSRSRSRSPSSSIRNKISLNSWRHDRFNDDDRFDHENDEDEQHKRKNLIPKDYRPPSPTWISKAGGVAIMKNKK